MAFKMRSGNGPLKFKTMGKSPLPQSPSDAVEQKWEIKEDPKYAEGRVPEHPDSHDAFLNHLYNVDRMVEQGMDPDEASSVAEDAYKEEIEMYKDQLYKESLKDI